MQVEPLQGSGCASNFLAGNLLFFIRILIVASPKDEVGPARAEGHVGVDQAVEGLAQPEHVVSASVCAPQKVDAETNPRFIHREAVPRVSAPTCQADVAAIGHPFLPTRK
ncbi:hypothetical protein ISF_00610 [Cordyceps fumosorosea ARSEF 2679]|uniref:Uncharacterized protein n=1 Tax=Cordyceps fumosorosea (strain ARSEF 2679) TaxID=1081104 RepID=A0A162N0U0_CORFA|nr:hypothetical protein ISF_00610 [Cordyceps fumosorosea ARSEF 2679]OAA73709.1 hypothetical protein ISF_00610 [Cordyceps fumosorosea ARSEF 2679]